MMAATGGSIVLQHNSNSTQQINSSSSATATSQSSPLAVRTLQGIRVIPVATTNQNTTKIHTPTISKAQQSDTQIVKSSQTHSLNSAAIPSHHQFVARIITTAQTNRGNIPQTQIVIPSTSALQPLFLAHPQSKNTNATVLQHMTQTTNTVNELQKVSITIPPKTSSS